MSISISGCYSLSRWTHSLHQFKESARKDSCSFPALSCSSSSPPASSGRNRSPAIGIRAKVLSSQMHETTFKEKPNIYLFVYDGIPNERVFREQNLPFERLKSLLDKHHFKLYDDSYTLGNCSLTSMGKMLDFTDKAITVPEGRDILCR